MPDWKPEIRGRLAGSKLEPAHEAAIIAELSQYLEDYHAELLAGGATEAQADRQTLTELSGSELLARELQRMKRQAPQEPIVLGTDRRANMIADLWQDLRKGRHFNYLLIIQAVRWYVTYKLSYSDVCNLMAERGVTVVHTTVLLWGQRFIPVFEKQWRKYARPVGSSWRVDETYIKVKGQWRYLYRAVDKQGQTVDFLLSKNRDKAAAVRFFKKAIGNHEVPEKITLEGSRASHQAVAELKAEGVLPAQTLVRTNRHVNNMVEQDHGNVKQRCYPMLGFKTFGNAEVTLSGIELANKIKKGQFDTSEITSPGAMILQVWETVLAA